MANLRVRVRPGASRNRVDCYEDGVLVLRVTAPPEAGRANAALTELLSDFIGVPRSRLRIVRGATSRNKIIEVQGMDDLVLGERLERLKKEGRD